MARKRRQLRNGRGLLLVGAALIVLAGCEDRRAQAPVDACTRWQTSALPLRPPFEHVSGHAYIVAVRSIRRLGDTDQRPRHSPYVLCEDGKVIGDPHAVHEAIATKGQGLYSHWGHALYFSASDNSDPNTNGRRYVLVRGPKGWFDW